VVALGILFFGNYDETKAHQIYETALFFFQDAFDLLQNLKQKNV